jgi:hypothetical protein
LKQGLDVLTMTNLEVLTMTNKESKSEIKRLREALEVYARDCHSDGDRGEVDKCHAVDCCSVAFRALKAKPSA